MNPSRQLTLDLVEPPRPSLENFIAGRNAEVVAALRAAGAGAGERFIYLSGEHGAGKSHLLRALGLDPEQARVPAFDSNRRITLIDDIDQLDALGQQRLFVLLNEIRGDAHTTFVGAGAAAPMHLALRDDVRTRLAWGLVYQVHALSDDEKAQALVAHAGSRGVALPPDVVEFLLTHMPRDMRTLIAIVEALDTYALSIKRTITLPLVRQWAGEGAPGSAQ